MRAVLTIFGKEFRENLRDRRTVMTALLLGPLFGPVFFSLMLQLSLDRTRVGADETIVLQTINAPSAPNLVHYLQSQRVSVEPATGDAAAARQLVATHRARLVLEVPTDYGERLASGRPAGLRLYADSSRTGDERYAARMETILARYAQQLAAQRLALRGIDTQLLSPVVVHRVDVSTPAARSLLVLGMMSFFIVLSMLTGGMYLAIDTTVGERERGTLEPLLATPVPRGQLVLGKLLATCAYMLLSLCISTTALCVALGRLDLEQYGMSANLGTGTALSIIAVTAPLIPLLAAVMTLLAAWTRSAREAQAWIGILQLLPTVPLVFASLLNLVPKLSLMMVPSLSQHFLITQILRAEPLNPLWLATSACTALLAGVLLLLPVMRLYGSERVLG
ncbi:MAG TPA: ABC transporter permease [Steroidobacteraceae bacterium]|nr:ABC transporter permease [Steroidobacteraceae bacterium]